MMTEPSDPKSRRGHLFFGWSLAASAVIVMACGTIIFRLKTEPSHDGKRLGAWFGQAVKLPGFTLESSESFAAITSMGADAVPFLTREINGRPSTLDKEYEKYYPRLPDGIRKILPTPKSQGDYYCRCDVALKLLARIGSNERFKSEIADPPPNNSIAMAVPSIQALLHHPWESIRADSAQALWFIGPPSTVALPDLIKLASDPRETGATSAVQAFGLIGPAASNAVETLADIVVSQRQDRLCAVCSLGGIGPVASNSAPALATLLNDTNETLRIAAARALGEIGVVPDIAVSPLQLMRQSTNAWERTVAAFALWNYDTNNEQMRTEVISSLESPQRGPLCASMRRLGIKAVPYLQKIKTLTNDPDSNVRQFALAAVRNIELAQK